MPEKLAKAYKNLMILQTAPKGDTGTFA